MKKILFLAVVACSFLGADANAGIFKKKVRCTNGCCSSCQTKSGSDTKVEAKPSEKKVEAPTPVKAPEPKAPTPVKSGKKVPAPQQ
jgi:hypothetical protein